MSDQPIKTKLERNMKAIERRPAVGQGTAVTTVRLDEGLAFDIEEGTWKLRSDMSEKHGGTNTGPNPGVFGRAALGSCLATSYALWAAKFGVTFTRLEIEVQADYDARGMYGLDDVPPGYTEIRYIVTVESESADEDVMRVLDHADACCDYLFVFREPNEVRREVRLLEHKA
jgi:uncharacterized OsmC-like protein